MISLIKKGLSLAGVLVVVALVLNLNVGGRPSRDIALELWQSDGVQKVYNVVKDRVLALIRKDISVEDVFKPELPEKSNASAKAPASSSPKSEAPTSAKALALSAKEPEKERVIHLEKLDEKDRQALEKILEKSSD